MNAKPKPARVARLLAHLDKPGTRTPSVELEPVGYVGAWRIQKGPYKNGVRPQIFYVYSPDKPPTDPSLPWACETATHCGTHGETVDFLRLNWTGPARAWLEVNK